MGSAATLLLASLGLSGLLVTTAAGETAWFYHVKNGGTGGKPVQSEANPGLNNCWNSINAAFAAVKSRVTPGPWIIQVDDEGTYDEAVALADIETSPVETLTLTKAPWLAGRPTIYPSQPNKRALAINGLWPGSSDPLPGQPGQPSRRLTYVTIRGFTLKNIAQGNDPNRDQPVFSDTQSYLTEGLHTIEDCDFDGQNQVYARHIAVFINGTCINTVFRRNVFHHFKMKEDLANNMLGYVFIMTKPVSAVEGQTQVTIADNKFYGNQGNLWECLGDEVNKWFYTVVFERNTMCTNASIAHSLVAITDNSRANIIRNNLISDNSGNPTHGTLYICNSSSTKIYHNTFVNNRMFRELALAGQCNNVEIKNNIFWPTAGSLCIDVQTGKGNLICVSNAFFADWKKDGYPPGTAFSTTENTETVGFWNNAPLTTFAWNNPSQVQRGIMSSIFPGALMNNSGNGYTLGGPGLDKNRRLVAGSLCIDRGVSDLVKDDIDGGPRPVGIRYDIGADEYGAKGPTRSLGGK
jgi:hypothetical protein